MNPEEVKPGDIYLTPNVPGPRGPFSISVNIVTAVEPGKFHYLSSNQEQGEYHFHAFDQSEGAVVRVSGSGHLESIFPEAETRAKVRQLLDFFSEVSVLAPDELGTP